MTSLFLDSLPVPNKPGDHRHWAGASDGSAALVIAEAALDYPGLTLVVAATTGEALRLEQELQFYLEGRIELLPLPDWETLPYDIFSPHEDIVSQRIRTLNRLPHVERGILVVPVRTLMQRLAPVSFAEGNTLVLQVGQKLDVDTWRLRLDAAGYRYAENVYEHGEYAVRGSIIDIFPMGADLPYRIDLFDNEVETLRTFDPDTQRSRDRTEQIELLPAHEFPWHPEARSAFRNRWFEKFPHAPREAAVYQDVAAGIRPLGIEYYLPLFFDQPMATLFDYLPGATLVFTPPRLEADIDHIEAEIQARYEDRRHDRLRPLLPPRDLFLAKEECFRSLKAFPRITALDSESASPNALDLPFKPLPEIAFDGRATDPARKLNRFLDTFSGRVLFTAETTGRREALVEQLREYDIRIEELEGWTAFLKSDARYGLTVASLEGGTVLENMELAVIPEAVLFGQRVMQRRRRDKGRENSEAAFRNLSELRIGSPVVHIDHGVGRYTGLTTIELEGQVNEFVTLEYADKAKLYLPVASLHLISRYSGSDDATAPLHKLGSDRWSQAKAKALEKIRDTAAELLDVYARRDARPGYAFDSPGEAYRHFSAGFPFEETPDQQMAIDAVMSDMSLPKPMDRLVCGDVGFGKTEVAMRAAFVATHAGRQVAVLVPTTLLAQQHYESFRDRFSDTPVQVELLSRFRSSKQQSTTITRIAEGKVDIVIGTHKLLQGDIIFKDLGLAIIDEEHRFGVNQKEKLKALRAEVDILTLTATPIPRTLNMAMGHLRDLSIIATPPARRLSVKTFIHQRDPALIKEAVLREILRGGQVYVLHNDVASIEKVADELTKLVPEARVAVAHGQMRERNLEEVMTDFYHKRFNVLVCTTIIETGIDIPSANTIIIERADKFGLAQLHQLRGRVGRSHHQAYAYLLTPEDRKLTPDAEKRLEAIAAAQDLGAGFMLATHDLEIRGAGELLGAEQSGQIETIGFSLYMELLEEAVAAIREGRTPNAELPLQHGTEINLRIPALIPDDYLPDVHNRLILYKRLASVKSSEALRELQVEMIDRFGLLPEPAKNLIRQTELRLAAESLGVIKVDAGGEWGRLDFASHTQIDPFTLVQLVQREPQNFKLENGNQLRFRLKRTDTDGKLQGVETLLSTLARSVPASKSNSQPR
ncbi:MAG: transcription-repair coupling factor [Alteromonadaceae bacterium]|nr:transcription-repair coupling factor [Alteromonadaceae bacterium]